MGNNMKNIQENVLLTNTLSTPMVYYNTYNYSPEDISLRYGAIKFGTVDDLNEYFKAGVSALQNKNVQLAISNFSKVVEMVPSFIPAVNNLGALYYSIGRINEAVYFFEQGIKKDPKNFQMRYNVGTLYLLNKNFDLAKDQLAQAKSLVPEDPAINNNLALSMLGVDIASSAGATIFADLVNKFDTFDIAFHNYAHFLSQKGQYDEALNFYQKALEKNNNSVITLNDIACCYYKKGSISEAVETLQSIISSTGCQFQPAIYNLGYIVFREQLLSLENLKK